MRLIFMLAVCAISVAIIIGTEGVSAALKAAPKAASNVVDVAKLKTSKEKLKTELQALGKLPKDLSCKADADCAAIEVGVKPCGGPWSYYVYSKRNSKVPLIKRKVAEYNNVDQSLNDAEPTMSDCSRTLPPEVHCVEKICVDTAAKPAAPAKAATPSPEDANRR